MHIKYIDIKNFRGMTLTITELETESLIIGRNDAGKSNICFAVRKILDYEVRKTQLQLSDSTNSNKEDIEITIRFNVFQLSDEHKIRIAKYLDDDHLQIKLLCQYDHDTELYNEEIFYGEHDTFHFATNRTNPIDEIIDFIYVNPTYKIDNVKSKYFKFHKEKDSSESENLSKEISDKVADLNKTISINEKVQAMKESIVSGDEFSEIFEEVQFKIESNIEVSNIYKSLDIIPHHIDLEENKINIGDGKSKTLSLVLQQLMVDSKKIKIIIVEEPENHMYPLLQKQFAQLMNKFKAHQIIFTTHSPNIINFKFHKQIIRIKNEGGNRTIKSISKFENINKDFGFLLNEEIASMFFYDEVILIEGMSEKLFYNVLFQENIDNEYGAKIKKRKVGFFCVGGIDFKPAVKILNKLGINTKIKTDNDIFKVPKKTMRRYAGIGRVISLLDDDGILKLNSIISKYNLNYKELSFSGQGITSFEDLNKISLLFLEYGVIISPHHDGFERDFSDFLNLPIDQSNELIDYLKGAKLKNLSEYISKNLPSMKVNSRNDSS